MRIVVDMIETTKHWGVMYRPPSPLRDHGPAVLVVPINAGLPKACGQHVNISSHMKYAA